MSGRVTLLVTCEHGGNRVPREHRALFAGQETLLATHRAFDPGALDTAKLLARRLEATLIASTVTRLLVELNRSPSHPKLYSEVTRGLSPSARVAIRERYYAPHRALVERTIARLLRRKRPVLHITSHSFTPSLAGEERRADVSWLYDPSRSSERAFAGLWKDALGRRRPELVLRRNYPYRGVDDGLTTHLRRLFPDERYLGIELEVNQKWYLGAAPARRRLRQDFVESLAAVLGGMGSKR